MSANYKYNPEKVPIPTIKRVSAIAEASGEVVFQQLTSRQPRGKVTEFLFGSKPDTTPEINRRVVAAQFLVQVVNIVAHDEDATKATGAIVISSEGHTLTVAETDGLVSVNIANEDAAYGFEVTEQQAVSGSLSGAYAHVSSVQMDHYLKPFEASLANNS